jgi:beta-lactam-binding protein with PASTA domain
MTIDQAEATLEAAGLSIGTIGRVESASAPKDTVISQEISSGESVTKDTS